jgi:hypothetical protein
VRSGSQVLGYIGADFDLRDLPDTSDMYHNPANWLHNKSDRALRNALAQQTRKESDLDKALDQTLGILADLITQRGIFQCQIDFSSSQISLWRTSDPFNYYVIDHVLANNSEISRNFPTDDYPANAAIAKERIVEILDKLKILRLKNENIYLRRASINIINGMIGLTFSCDGSNQIQYDQFLDKNSRYWIDAQQ